MFLSSFEVESWIITGVLIRNRVLQNMYFVYCCLRWNVFDNIYHVDWYICEIRISIDSRHILNCPILGFMSGSALLHYTSEVKN